MVPKTTSYVDRRPRLSSPLLPYLPWRQPTNGVHMVRGSYISSALTVSAVSRSDPVPSLTLMRVWPGTDPPFGLRNGRSSEIGRETPERLPPQRERGFQVKGLWLETFHLLFQNPGKRKGRSTVPSTDLSLVGLKVNRLQREFALHSLASVSLPCWVSTEEPRFYMEVLTRISLEKR